ncbi:MAG TPA: tyrosine-type recombinase/integrase [Nitrososphaeraceae archaeon]|jgi:integrase
MERRQKQNQEQEQQGLQGEKVYLNFINSLHSKATIKVYRVLIIHYIRFMNIKSNNISSLLNQDHRIIEEQIISYLVYLRTDQKLSYSSLALRLAAIRKFYEMNDVMLNWKKVSNYLGENTKLFKDRAYITEEIQRLLTKADERMRVIILLLASTGMRIGAIPGLNLKHLTKVEDYNLYQITVYENTKDEYYCFCSPECANAIDSYIAYRERCYEKIGPESPLIREQFDRDNPDKARNPRLLSLDTPNALIRELLIVAGIRSIEHLTETQTTSGRLRKEVKASHGFRKFATTNMIRAKVNPEAREMLLGHSIGLSDSYYRPDANEILQEYLKAVDLLTINEENRLRRQIESQHIEHTVEWEQIRKMVDEIRERMGL